MNRELRGLDLLNLDGAGQRSYGRRDGDGESVDDHDHEPDGEGFVVTVRRRARQLGLGGPVFTPRRVHVACVDGWWREVRSVVLPSSLLPARTFPERRFQPGRPLVPIVVREGARVHERQLTLGTLDAGGASVPARLMEADVTVEVLGATGTPFGPAWRVRTVEAGPAREVITDDLYLPGVGLAVSSMRVRRETHTARWLETPPGPLRVLLGLLDEGR